MHAPCCDALRCAQAQPRPRSTSVGGSSPPAPSLRPDMHGATGPRRSMPIGAPIALPVGPPDDAL
eukprot:6404001-Prymnesium_polylepis.1